MTAEPRRTVAPGMRAQLDASSYQGIATFGMRPRLTEPEQLDEWRPDVALLRVVRQIVLDTNVVAMDVTEVSPPYDHADITVNNAHGLIWEALAALAYKNRASTNSAAKEQGGQE